MITIRDATIQDAERLLAIYAYYVEHTAISWEWEVPSIEEFRGRIQRTLQRYPYLVAQKDGVVVGYTYAGPFVGRRAYDWSCELTIYLDPEARGEGLGRALYEALEDRLKRMGIQNMYACIGYPDEDDEYVTKNSAQFHEHMGFTLAGTFHKCGYKFGRWYNMVWMEKLIGAHE